MARCSDCINSQIPIKYCMMEECVNQENGYCKGCPCDGCNCIDPEKDLERLKFSKKN